MDTLGGRFLSENEDTLVDSKPVQYNAEQKDIHDSSPAEQVSSWTDTVVDIYTKHRDSSEVMDRIKQYYYDKYVIKDEDFPESYFINRQRTAAEEGRGYAEITDSLKRKDMDMEQKDQKQSLDWWIDYFASPDSNHLPSWMKYWAFNGMVKLARYNEEKKEFEPRMKDTVSNFIYPNRAALAKTLDILQAKYGKEYFNLTDRITEKHAQLKGAESLERKKRILELVEQQGLEQVSGRNITVKDEKTGQIMNVRRRDLQKMREEVIASKELKHLSSNEIREEIQSLINQRSKVLEERGVPKEFTNIDIKDEDFAKLYTYAYNEVQATKYIEKEIVDGQWVKFPHGSDPKKLVEAIQGFGTEWCTEGESTAEKQLEQGDFYIYFSNDSEGNPVNPRIAIKMEWGQIGEIRGIEKDQELDSYILESGVLEEKLKEFGAESAKYYQRVEDMKRMTRIDKQVKAGEDLTQEDLWFLYEIDRRIEGFGFKKDPRIEEILSKRNLRKDLACIFNCSEHQISLTKEEALRGDIKYHHGRLDVNHLIEVKDLVLPERIWGDLTLGRLTTASGLIFPKNIGGSLIMNNLTEIKDSVFPENIQGSLRLNGLTRAKDLVLPENVGGDVTLDYLESAKGLVFPKSIGRDLQLNGLKNAKDLILPESIGRNLELNGLRSAKGLVIPDGVVKEALSLSNLRSTKGLNLPKGVKHVYIGKYISNEELFKLRRQYPDINIQREKDLSESYKPF